MKGSKTHSNRPIYRGKKGIQDGKIPQGKKKKNARKPERNKYEIGDDNADAGAMKTSTDLDALSRAHSAKNGEMSSNVPLPLLNENIKELNENENIKEQVASKDISPEHKAIIKEIKHVRRRITNIQESVHLSTNIAQPHVWEDNCLNAVLNCVDEWRTIVAFHGDARITCTYSDGSTSHEGDNGHLSSELHIQNDRVEIEPRLTLPVHDGSQTNDAAEDHPMHPENEWSKTTSLQIHGLIQMAMQTGPLKGSSPGYFKRCGVNVAKMARIFLAKCVRPYRTKDENIANPTRTCTDKGIDHRIETLDDSGCAESVLSELRFTMKQKDSLGKWMKNADKAIAANKSPSKSALKLHKSVNTKGMSRKDKRKKGKLVKQK